MLIYDRRRCRPLDTDQVRQRMTITQRAQLGLLEQEGWRLLFVRGEPAGAFVEHSSKGYGLLSRDGRMIAVRSLPVRGNDAVPAVAAELEQIAGANSQADEDDSVLDGVEDIVFDDALPARVAFG